MPAEDVHRGRRGLAPKGDSIGDSAMLLGGMRRAPGFAGCTIDQDPIVTDIPEISLWLPRLVLQ